jgi:two-component sensor histidine kinase
MVNSYGMVPQSIDVAVNAAGIELSIRRAIPCALLINELITNALKHAYPDGSPGRIEVDFGRKPDSGELVLAVRDRGRGLPPDFDIDRVETVGMQLVRLLAAQIGGRLTIHLKQPTMFRVVFHDREG